MTTGPSDPFRLCRPTVRYEYVSDLVCTLQFSLLSVTLAALVVAVGDSGQPGVHFQTVQQGRDSYVDQPDLFVNATRGVKEAEKKLATTTTAQTSTSLMHSPWGIRLSWAPVPAHSFMS